jgi:osmoprotectant transport system ATP-binding protein
MITAKNLNKRYNGVPAVIDISFDVAEGEVTPDSGSIFINGKDVQFEKPELLRRGIGYVLQNHGLFPHFTVSDNIALVPKLLYWKPKEINRRTEELFEKLGLDPQIKTKYPSELSGGQQQRVGLARALMVNPPVLLMDEPFGALDNLTRIHIRKEFMMLDELVKKTIVMVTHDVQEAFEMADRICLMNKGRIMQIGRPEELLFSPANDFVSGFLDEHRLQLELKSVKTHTLFPESTVEGQRSVWETMDELVNKSTTKEDELNLSTLMKAFQQYKNN